MKSKYLQIFCLMVVSLLVPSCENRPSEADMKACLAALSLYYPYSINDKYVFVNDSLDRTWIGRPYDYYKDGVYPHTELFVCNTVGAQCYGDRMVSIQASLATDGLDTKVVGFGIIETDVNYSAGSFHVGWRIRIHLSEEESVTGGFSFSCSEGGFYEHLKDTILLPIPYQISQEMHVNSTAEGYARVVKNKGLVDFSIDGKTVWKRVKE